MKENTSTLLDIDYGAHPGFAAFRNEQTTDTSALREIFREFDCHLRLLGNSPEALPKKFIQTYFARQIDPLFKELLEGSLAIMGDGAWYAPILPGAFRDARNALLEEMIYRNENTLLRQQNPIPSSKLGKELSENGCAFMLLPRDELAKVAESVEGFKPQVLELRKQQPWEVASLPLKHEGRHWDLTLDIVRRAGVFEALAEHHGCQMELLHLALIHSCPGEDWYKDCYADVGVPTSRTSYMHFDHGYDVVKILMYLTDVTRENGPFSIVPKSRDLIPSYAQAVLFKFMDKHADNLADKDPRFTAQYRRKRYKFPELRKELMRLPQELRGTSHFGEDVLDDSPLSQTLLQQEVVCTSDVANSILFDGACTIHRGGLVQKGERWVFQMGFRRPNLKR